MRSSPRARAAFLLLYGALLAWQIDRWLLTPHGLVSTWEGRHAGLTVSAGSPRGISQTFVMGADGFDGLWLRPRTDGRRAAGHLVVDLLQLEGAARVRVERVALPAKDVVPGRDLHVPLRPIRQSRGRAYQIDVRHLHAAEGPALEFSGTREDTLPGARFFADGTEQWGDLVFETTSRRATLPYWLHEVLRPWPAWVSAWPTVAVVLLAFNAVLAGACAMATGVAGDSAPTSGAAPVIPASGGDARRTAVAGLRRVSRAAAGAIAFGGMVICMWPASSAREVDLLAHVPDARFESRWPIHGGIVVGPAVFFQRVHRALFMLPPATVTWTIDVPPDAVLIARGGGRADLWESPSDGFSMIVEVVEAGRVTPIARLGLFPLGVPAHRNLHPVEASLAPWRGRRVQVRFRVDPGDAGNAVNDVPIWVEPRIRCGRRPCGAIISRATP